MSQSPRPGEITGLEYVVVRRSPSAGNLSGSQTRKLHLLTDLFTMEVTGLDRASRIRLFRRWRELIAYMREGIHEFSTEMPSDYGTARALLGEDFVSPEDIQVGYLELDYTPEQIKALHKALPSKETLEWCRANRYIVIAAPPRTLSLLDIYRLSPELFRNGRGDWRSEADEDFCQHEYADGKWLIVRADVAPHSLNKNWEHQQRILGQDDYVPTVAQMAWVITAYYRSRGHARVFEDRLVRTSSHDAAGDTLFVGRFSKAGLLISARGERFASPDLGLAIARKT